MENFQPLKALCMDFEYIFAVRRKNCPRKSFFIIVRFCKRSHKQKDQTNLKKFPFTVRAISFKVFIFPSFCKIKKATM